MNKIKVISIVGPTASGKSALAVAVAKAVEGEVISADSRQVYRGLDIGSGKITKAEMEEVPHHLLDVADLSTTYTATDFAKDATIAINRIASRGKVPIIAGGTFFYIDLLLGRTQNAPVPPNPVLRESYEKFSTADLFTELQKQDPSRAKNIDSNNRHRIIRSLEIIALLGKVPQIPPSPSPFDTITLGIKIDKEVLEKQIEKRLEKRLDDGRMITEIENLLKSGVGAERLKSFGLEYRYLTEYINQEISEAEMRRLIKTKSWQYAKRQYTWLKRQKDIVWFEYPINPEEVIKTVEEFLAS